MAEVILYGSLRRQFGRSYNIEIHRVSEAFRALDAQLPGFGREIRSGSFRVVRGENKNGSPLSVEELMMGVGRLTKIHVIPVVAGAKGKGGAKAILGIAIMGIAIVASGGIAAATAAGAAEGAFAAAMAEPAFTLPILGEVSFGSIARFGFTMALTGISQMLSPQPKMKSSFESADKRASFTFNGAVNSQEQGGAVPVVYGRMRVGSSVVSASINVEQVAVTDTTTTSVSAPTVANVNGVQGGSFTDPIIITKGATAASFIKFTAITGGTLWRSDKITEITNDSHLSLTDISGGVLFKPTNNTGGSFVVQQLTAELTTVGDTTTATIPTYIFDTL